MQNLKKEILALIPVNLPAEHGKFMIDLTAALTGKGMPYPTVVLEDESALVASFRVPSLDPKRPCMPSAVLSISVFEDQEEALVAAAGERFGGALELLIGADMEEHVKAVYDLWLRVTE